MCELLLYHGSTSCVERPLTNVGRPDLDFGPGFYVTSLRSQAEAWAQVLARRKRGARPVLNTYSFDEEGFLAAGVYRRKCFESYDEQWLRFIVASRKGQRPWVDYDWIEGGVANDKVITTVDAFVDGFITMEQAIGNLRFASPNHQACIRTQAIINSFLTFREAEILSLTTTRK